jgi:hypothetical protein
MQLRGQPSETTHVVSEIANTTPAKLKQYFSDNPSDAVYMLFHGEITNTVKQLHAINRAKEIIRHDAKVRQQQKQQVAQLEGFKGKQLHYATAVVGRCRSGPN